jgi:hypothetical protein
MARRHRFTSISVRMKCFTSSTVRCDSGSAVTRSSAAPVTVIAPKGVPHAFRVDSASGAHCLTIMRGADFETMIRQASRPALRPGLPEAATPTPDLIDRLVKICAANKIDIIGPPLA